MAYPIDNGTMTQDQINNLNNAKLDLLGSGVDVIYDPGDAFVVKQGATPGDEIDWINRRAHSTADGVFAFMPAGMATIGVPIEIDRALSQGKWVALCSDSNSWMLQDKRKGLARFGTSREDLGFAASWLASQIDSPYPLERRDRALPVLALDEHAVLPQRRYSGDAGIDLVVSSATRVPARSWRDVPNGVAVELPEGTFGWIVGRSSTRRDKGLFVHTGIIDEGYRGELFSMVENTTDEAVTIEQGERVAQLIIVQNTTRSYDPILVQTLNPSERGTNGFGSTGR